MLNGQSVDVNCNYTTNYAIPESSGYYMYDGIDLTIDSYYTVTADVRLQRVQITRLSTRSGTPLFNGFFTVGTPSCQTVWRNRCTNTFDQDADCDPCHFSVTLHGYNTSIDDAMYVSNVATNRGTENCLVALTGKNNSIVYLLVVFS